MSDKQMDELEAQEIMSLVEKYANARVATNWQKLESVVRKIVSKDAAIKAGWRAAIHIHSHQGMGGWSAYREEGFAYARSLLNQSTRESSNG